MRIGIDGGCLANRRGFGRFARQMVEALAVAGSPHEFTVFVDRPSLESVTIPEGMETVAVEVSQAPSRAASASGRRRVGDLLAMGRAVARANLDLIYFPASYSFFPVWNAGRVVVTMHDTLALAHPEWVFPTWQGKMAWRAKEQAAALWSDRIVTVSESARRDLVDWFGLPEEKVRVVTEGPDAAFCPGGPGPESDEVLRRYGIEPGTRYLLYVGGLSPHKNLPRLIEAFALAGAVETRLILVGDLGDVFHTHVPELRETIERFGLGDRVHFTGFVPDLELAHLYRRAYALAQPSLMEGFGLPPVEAMACGTPVLCSTAGSLPEVVGEAGVYFDPTDIEAMTDAIQALIADPAERDRLARVALERSGKFTWESAARSLLDCFEELDPGQTIQKRISA
ncbi:glycosyltransferase family 4 protein [Tundrisphaera lichenicola]|uniref:glycosyltransferase family 4 protein n=1 Tax=Tundrisphaera lichenicola TaxID=2029860 RepID=UPI003EB87037